MVGWVDEETPVDCKRAYPDQFRGSRAETEAARKALEEADEKQTFVRRENGIYTVEGKWLENFMNQLNLNDYDQLNRFQQVLEKNGVIDMLREAGVRDGDTVEIYGFSFDFYY